MKAVLIPGDGIGREIAQSVRKISDVLATGIEWEEYAVGAEYAAEPVSYTHLVCAAGVQNAANRNRPDKKTHILYLVYQKRQ